MPFLLRHALTRLLEATQLASSESVQATASNVPAEPFQHRSRAFEFEAPTIEQRLPRRTNSRVIIPPMNYQL
ncbi:hypothetical protein HZU75_08400 [Chitinibacter fontanus]|uniref:Uncharacterized protein n=1 Tax=Chitinibacter fontanus TaxID=1737446 RepID=A0A7D5ZGQ4_9NEIS|nr:hypothetical protein [Chitinibacter fontanus]QLI81547.1 hypothetical protein HZU75_08400 [Chitinibacter fontanus]